MTQTSQRLPVESADRARAATYQKEIGAADWVIDAILNGDLDYWPIVQGFTRCRMETQAEVMAILKSGQPSAPASPPVESRAFWQTQPQCSDVSNGPEPHLRALILRYYSEHFTIDESKKLTTRYIEKLVETVSGRMPPGDSPRLVLYSRLNGDPIEEDIRADLHHLLKHHHVLNGVLEADLTAAIKHRVEVAKAGA